MRLLIDTHVLIWAVDAPLPISVDHADVQSGLSRHHRDPFDRLLAAQAQVEDLALVSADLVFDLYGLTRIW